MRQFLSLSFSISSSLSSSIILYWQLLPDWFIWEKSSPLYFPPKVIICVNDKILLHIHFGTTCPPKQVFDWTVKFSFPPHTASLHKSGRNGHRNVSGLKWFKKKKKKKSGMGPAACNVCGNFQINKRNTDIMSTECSVFCVFVFNHWCIQVIYLCTIWWNGPTPFGDKFINKTQWVFLGMWTQSKKTTEYDRKHPQSSELDWGHKYHLTGCSSWLDSQASQKEHKKTSIWGDANIKPLLTFHNLCSKFCVTWT